MDIITQGLVGATVAQAGAKPAEVRLATVIGFCAPLLADADTLIRSTEDPLLFLESHRHFTHALLFIPAGALIASLLLWPLLKKQLGFKKIYLYAFLGYATAGLLDACTSYGTHLLWPFSDTRTAWSIISILDPVFSLGLIFALVTAFRRKKPAPAYFGLSFAALYLMLGTLQHERAASKAREMAQQRGHNIERLIVKPTIGNLILWRSVYESEGMYHVDAVRVGLFGESNIFSGERVEVFDLKEVLPQLTEQQVIYEDIRRFEKFSDGYLAWHPERPTVLGDVRFAMVPTSTVPLWGIELNLDAPDEHVQYNTYRTLSETNRRALISMLFN